MSCVRTTVIVALLALGASAGPAVADADSRSAAYKEAQRAIEQEDWTEASRRFAMLASGSSAETDAALYWKAYADWKRHDRRQSLESVRRLLADYPKSSWADDAKVLEQEIRGGGASKAASEEDEELKLYALDGLLQVDPAQAVPVLEKLLAGGSSARVKERALFVLSQSDSPRVREILVRTATTGRPTDLRVAAIKTLGIAGMTNELAVVAKDTQAPADIKEAVIEAYLIADRPDLLLEIARSDPDPRMRAKAMNSLGAMGAVSSLRQLLSTERDPALREELLQGLGIAGDAETLAKIARESRDPEERGKAIDGLGVAEGEPARKTLRQLYGELQDPDDKRQVAQALMVQGDAKALIELFRAERDPALKKMIVQQLSVIDDPEASRLILDLLGDSK